MGAKSSIEWTESTWNPVTGCTKVSEGCRNCYAERMAKRLQAMGQRNYRDGFKVAIHESAFDLPLRWKRPQVVFVNSMSDLFHDAVPTECIGRLFVIMNRANWHIFQILTKRASRLAELGSQMSWSDNVWMGVTVEHADYASRIDELRSCGARVKFLSLEPLLGPLPDLDLAGIDWVIAGGESGPGARPMREEWVREVRDQCERAGVAFFFKQWGGINKKKAGRILDGRVWDEMPECFEKRFSEGEKMGI
jgi:protein gp37